MNSQEKLADLPVVEKLKSWLWIAVWTIAGAAAGTLLAYVLFGLIYDAWNATDEQFPAPTPKRSGDPIDSWARGYVIMMMAFPVALAGLIAGTFIGFRLGYRRYQKTVRSWTSTCLFLLVGLTLTSCGLFYQQEVVLIGDDHKVTEDKLAGSENTSRTGKVRSSLSNSQSDKAKN